MFNTNPLFSMVKTQYVTISLGKINVNEVKLLCFMKNE